jgi:Tfp pilus assembly protein PilF
VEKDPGEPAFQYHLGMAYFKQGDKIAAREHLSKAIEGEASYDGVEEARSTLESL